MRLVADTTAGQELERGAPCPDAITCEIRDGLRDRASRRDRRSRHASQRGHELGRGSEAKRGIEGERLEDDVSQPSDDRPWLRCPWDLLFTLPLEDLARMLLGVEPCPLQALPEQHPTRIDVTSQVRGRAALLEELRSRVAETFRARRDCDGTRTKDCDEPRNAVLTDDDVPRAHRPMERA
jgi:hypothetical protein